MLLFRELYERGLANECAIMIDHKESHEKPRVKLKEEYSPPTLTNYGCISKLTRGGKSVGNDGNTECTPSTSNDSECIS
jgi:hypothetical protein